MKDYSSSGFRFSLWWIVILTVVSVVIIRSLYSFQEPREISWLQFERKILSKGAAEKLLVVNNEKVEVYLNPAFLKDTAFVQAFEVSRFTKQKFNPGPHYYFIIGSVESFERKLDHGLEVAQIEPGPSVQYESRRSLMTDLLPWILPAILLFFLIRSFNSTTTTGSSAGPNVLSFGRTTARLQERGGTSSTTFADVAGLEEAKFEVKEICDFLKDPGKYTSLGARIPKGVMIVGPPGTGKTLLAKAVAGEARVPFFSISGSEFVEMFVGVGASRVRDLFRMAKEKAPCIIFIDEIDAVGRSRGGGNIFSGANDERESTLNQLLTEMDGFGSNSGVIVLAATNRADVLDPALLRPGRFDRHIYLELPGITERKQIFQVHLLKMKAGTDVDLDFLAAQTPGFSGADIANICNEAALIAARDSKPCIERIDFMNAIDRVVAGLERKTKIISPAEKQIIACHEAGHAIASWFLPNIDPLLKVSIIPRGKTLGAAWYLPAERQIRKLSEFKERLSAMLAGRAAEELVFGEVSSGALDDLEKVTKEAYTMVMYYGFNKKVGNVSFFDSSGRQENSLHNPYSEETARLIDEEVRKIIEDAYELSLELLSSHRAQLSSLTDKLLLKEIVYQKELDELLGKRTALKQAAFTPVDQRILSSLTAFNI
jgi:AFG3 family protein